MAVKLKSRCDFILPLVCWVDFDEIIFLFNWGFRKWILFMGEAVKMRKIQSKRRYVATIFIVTWHEPVRHRWKIAYVPVAARNHVFTSSQVKAFGDILVSRYHYIECSFFYGIFISSYHHITKKEPHLPTIANSIWAFTSRKMATSDKHTLNCWMPLH